MSERTRLASDTDAPEEAAKLINAELRPADALEPDTATSGVRSCAHGVKVVVYVGLYLFCGPALILINNKILREHRFHFPMALSGLGLLCTSLVSSVLVFSGCVRLVHSDRLTRSFVVYNLLPVGAALAGTFACGNAVYLYLPVGFIQMLKAFTPATTLAMLWCSGIEVPTCRVLLSVIAICVGTALATAGEGSFHPLGLMLMLGAEVSEATRLVLTQKLLQNFQFGVIEGQFYLAPLSALWLFGAASIHELPRALRTEAWSVPQQQPLLFCASACLGLAVSVSSFLVIKATGSVTLKVLGTARAAGLVVWSAVMLGEQIAPLEAAGYSVSLAAFGAYNYFKATRR